MGTPTKRKSDPLQMQETDIPLPADPGAFVDEIHHEVELWQQWINLLKSDDQKIRARAFERLAHPPRQTIIKALKHKAKLHKEICAQGSHIHRNLHSQQSFLLTIRPISYIMLTTK